MNYQEHFQLGVIQKQKRKTANLRNFILILGFLVMIFQVAFEKYSKLKQQQTKIYNEWKKQNELDKYFSMGLESYYQSIQQKIKIIHMKDKNANQLYLINSLDTQNQDKCKKQIQFLLQNNNKIGTQIICIFKESFYSNNLQQYLKNKNLGFQVKKQRIDSTYGFLLNNIAQNIKNILYFDGYFTPLLLQQISKLSQNENYYSHIIISHNSNFSLSSNIAKLKQKDLQNFIIILKRQILKIIAPLNFAYQDVYTFQQLVIYPILALSQITSQLQIQSSNNLVNKQQQSINSNKTQFVLSKLQPLSNHICFIANPNNLSQNNKNEISKYLTTFQQYLKSKTQTVNQISIYLSVIYSQKSQLTQIFSKILQLSKKGISIKVSMKQYKIQVSLQAYEAAYAYCPQKSLIFASRMNVQPNLQNIIQTAKQSQVCQNNKTWIILNKNENSNSNSIQLPNNQNVQNLTRQKYLSYYSAYFENAQIFCQQLMRSMRYTIVRWQQLQFYETQASYIIPMFQKIGPNYYLTTKLLYNITDKKIVSQKQQTQLKGLYLRTKIEYQKQKPLIPIQYSELNNHGLKRNAPQMIPRIIHQIWLSDANKISPIREALINTLKNTNPTYKYILWTQANITREQFPITYDGIRKFQRLSFYNGINLKALVADLMRVQILYKYGGIYLDLKYSGQKSIDSFLKYDEFYFDVNEIVLSNSFIGSVKGNRHFRTMLEDFYRPKNLGIPQNVIFELTGGGKMIQAYTKKQIYTQTMGFAQFIYEGPRPCVIQHQYQKPDSDQQSFEGIMTISQELGKPYYINIPCKKDTQKYLQIYDIIGRTYSKLGKNFS